jgi:hypothetical protein
MEYSIASNSEQCNVQNDIGVRRNRRHVSLMTLLSIGIVARNSQACFFTENHRLNSFVESLDYLAVANSKLELLFGMIGIFKLLFLVVLQISARIVYRYLVAFNNRTDVSLELVLTIGISPRILQDEQEAT